MTNVNMREKNNPDLIGFSTKIHKEKLTNFNKIYKALFPKASKEKIRFKRFLLERSIDSSINNLDSIKEEFNKYIKLEDIQ